eukprot:TRINITY_DN17971_c0_g1_i1.p1 TRINITY_DN17971_c0_g1~~TRINITY_DN17971_c0_g1_i1.p1  ORF type:complete len:401 (+),score=57.78 TRINITY_DN17971_c0_g1_i1:145-1203(+)
MEEKLCANDPEKELLFVDCTFGRGGHTKRLLEDFSNSKVYALDADEDAINSSESQELQDKYPTRFFPVQAWFGDLKSTLASKFDIHKVHGILFDLGLCSTQLLEHGESGRGFSFKYKSPLDMRFGRDLPQQFRNGQPAAPVTEFLRHTNFETLRNILRRLGEEVHATRIAESIFHQRMQINTSADLTDVVHKCFKRNFFTSKKSRKKVDHSTKTFQALRVYVNNEFLQLKHGITDAESLLHPGGRMSIITFHSLEDRIVKTFLNYCSLRVRLFPVSDYEGLLLQAGDTAKPSMRIVNRRVITPTGAEELANPRSRSAKLRSAERTDAPCLAYDAFQKILQDRPEKYPIPVFV